jgi:hypothetical protein
MNPATHAALPPTEPIDITALFEETNHDHT